jgi:hypothetical protein
MMKHRSSIAAPLLAAMAIVLLPLGAYVGGYFWLGHYSEFNFGRLVDPPRDYTIASRTFPHHALATLYRPAGRVESWLRGFDVDLSHLDPEPSVRATITLPGFDEPMAEEMLEELHPEEEPPRTGGGVRIIINEATGSVAS